jgi:hypothetical protein
VKFSVSRAAFGVPTLKLQTLNLDAQVVRLVDLLDEAKARCRVTIEERRAERNEPISPEVRRSAAPRRLLLAGCLHQGRDAACVVSMNQMAAKPCAHRHSGVSRYHRSC